MCVCVSTAQAMPCHGLLPSSLPPPDNQPDDDDVDLPPDTREATVAGADGRGEGRGGGDEGHERRRREKAEGGFPRLLSSPRLCSRLKLSRRKPWLARAPLRQRGPLLRLLCGGRREGREQRGGVAVRARLVDDEFKGRARSVLFGGKISHSAKIGKLNQSELREGRGRTRAGVFRRRAPSLWRHARQVSECVCVRLYGARVWHELIEDGRGGCGTLPANAVDACQRPRWPSAGGAVAR